jgi:hypothetical protein
MTRERRAGDGDGPPTPPAADLSGVRTVPVGDRPNKVRGEDFASPPTAGGSFADFLASLPDILEARSFRAVVDAIADAHRQGRPVVVMMGGHIVKTGVGPILIDLVRRGVITHLASNGSAVIHDYELARWGGTSEDVEAALADGSFGMADETGAEINGAITRGAEAGWGLGEALGRALEEHQEAGGLAHGDRSLLLAARRHAVPFTVHAALGAEIVHQHPAADGAAIGATSHTDFRRLAAALEPLDGGVVLNLGSAVIMPEVFLKALTICRNLHDGRPRAFTAVDLDMIRHYRPRMNVVERPTRTGGGTGYQITGHHEIMVPLLGWAVVERLRG